MCQVVAYKRFQTKENYKPSPRADLGVGPGGPAPDPPPPRRLLWFIKYFSFTCSIWNLKILPEEHVPKTPQKSAPFGVLMGTIAPILPLYTISLRPLYHKILSPPLLTIKVVTITFKRWLIRTGSNNRALTERISVF